MFASDSFLHFILDADNDIHYTDSLVAMGPKSYVWYQLRRQGAAQNILLCDFDTQDTDQLRLDAFDPDSARFLEQLPKPVFSFGKKDQQTQVLCNANQNLKLTEEDLLAKLLSTADSDGNKTALCFTHESFSRVCRKTNERGAKLLRDRLSRPAGKCMLFIWLPCRAEQLEQLLCSDFDSAPLLSQVYAHIRSAASLPPVPLIDALTDLLSSQLLRFDCCPGEMMNLLLKQALDDPQAADTLEDLTYQAEYLELCRQHRTGILAPSAETDHCAPLSRRKLGERVRDPDFRQELRSRTAELRSRYAYISIEDAMQLEGQLPPALPCPAYDDNLSRMVLSLTLPDAYFQDDHPERSKYPPMLAQIKQNLTILWNKPRNPEAIQAASELCSNAIAAIHYKTWETLDVMLSLLQFFSRQICAPADQTSDLEMIRGRCSDIIKQCNYVYGDRSLGLPTDLDGIVHTAINLGDKTYLEQLKFNIHNAIQRFEKPDIACANINSELIADRARIVQDIQRSNQLLNDQREQQQALLEAQERERRNAELARRYTIDGGAEIEPEDCAENSAEDNIRSVNELLKKHNLLWN